MEIAQEQNRRQGTLEVGMALISIASLLVASWIYQKNS